MSPARVIDQDRAAIALGEPKTALRKCALERAAGIRSLPARERGAADIGNGDIGTFGLGALARHLHGDRAAAVEKSGGLHAIGNIGAPIFPESLRDGPVMLPLGPRKAERELRDPADLLSAGVFMGKVGNLPVRPNQRVREVVVRAAVLDVLHAAALNVLKAEFPLIRHHEEVHDGFRIGTARRIDVDMVHRAIGPTVAGSRHEFAELAGKVGGGEMASVQNPDFLPPFAAQEMASERWTACTSGGTGDHMDRRVTRRPASRCTARSSDRTASASA